MEDIHLIHEVCYAHSRAFMKLAEICIRYLINFDIATIIIIMRGSYYGTI